MTEPETGTEPGGPPPGRRPPPRDPWRDAPTGELSDQVLPRWFVLTALALVPVAIAAGIAAFFVGGGEEVPPAARRPPPTAAFTTGVSDLVVGEVAPRPVDAACAELDGLRIAGEQADRAALLLGLEAFCDLPPGQRAPMVAFAADGGVLRFATFAETGVDSTASRDKPLILVNQRFAVTDPAWIAPLLAHDLSARDQDPAQAENALTARRAEADACAALFDGSDEPGSRACADARAVLADPDPLAALREAGYR